MNIEAAEAKPKISFPSVISNNENILAFVDGGSGPTLKEIFDIELKFMYLVFYFTASSST